MEPKGDKIIASFNLTTSLVMVPCFLVQKFIAIFGLIIKKKVKFC